MNSTVTIIIYQNSNTIDDNAICTSCSTALFNVASTALFDVNVADNLRQSFNFSHVHI